MRVVLDANVVVSRFLSSKGAPVRVFDLWEAGAFQVVVSPSILGEHQRALLYDRVARYHGFSAGEVQSIVGAIQRLSVVVEPRTTPDVILEDADDNKFLACAVEGQADYIISGDAHLLDLGRYEEIEILSPRAFVTLVGGAA